MKIKNILGCLALFAASISANAQMMHGNTFPFWTVTGPLIVGGTSTFSGAVTAGAITTTGINTFSLVTDATSSTAAATIVTGGLAVAKKINVGTDVTLGGALIVSTTGSPAAADACTAGKIVWDASYIYVCTATGVWKRAALTGSY